MESSGWRTVVINSHSKLTLLNNNLNITRDDGNNTVPLSQVRTLIINTGEVSVSAKLLSELNCRNVKVIFCDDSHLPCCEICGYSNNVNSAGRHFAQIHWSEEKKNEVWAKIIKNKILSQYRVLQINFIRDAEALLNIAESVNPANAVVQEALAARIYFSLLFGRDFNRRTISLINSALNYGYSIILSSVSRAIAIHGYLTSLGINHCSQKNPFNLSCDIMEPFRAYVDNFVYRNPVENLDWPYKQELINLGMSTVTYNKRKTDLQTALDMYVNDVLLELTEENTSRIGRLDFNE